jgi:hypothetical protein
MIILASLGYSFCRKKIANPRDLKKMGRSLRTLKLKDFLRRKASNMSSLLPTHFNKMV